jgi:hypothetical protein
MSDFVGVYEENNPTAKNQNVASTSQLGNFEDLNNL